MTVKVIIIDDEPLARSILTEYLSGNDRLEILAECSNGFEGLKAIQEGKPDLVFLDVQMPKINGFEMLELLENPVPVIFTTAYDEYAIKAFELNAVDYLLKPFSRGRLEAAVEKFLNVKPSVESQKLPQVLELNPARQNRVVVKDGSKIKVIPVQKIQYFMAADDYVKIYTSEGVFLKKSTMSFFEESLRTHHFVRVHRSYLVNSQLITRIEPYEKEGHLVILTTGVSLPVSRTGYGNLKEVLGI